MTKYEPYPACETPKVGDRVRVTYVEEGIVEESSGNYLALPIAAWDLNEPADPTIERAIPEKPTFQEAFAALEVGECYVTVHGKEFGPISLKTGSHTAEFVESGSPFVVNQNFIGTLKRITIEED